MNINYYYVRVIILLFTFCLQVLLNCNNSSIRKENIDNCNFDSSLIGTWYYRGVFPEDFIKPLESFYTRKRLPLGDYSVCLIFSKDSFYIKDSIPEDVYISFKDEGWPDEGIWCVGMPGQLVFIYTRNNRKIKTKYHYYKVIGKNTLMFDRKKFFRK
jgi:hypothetical protein